MMSKAYGNTVHNAYRGLGGKGNLEQAELWLLRVPALYPGRHFELQ